MIGRALVPVLLAAAPAAALTFDDVVRSNPVLDADAVCAYTVSSVVDDSVLEERFDAGTWRLVAVDGAAPDAEATREWDKAGERRERRNHPLAFDPSKLAQPGTIEILGEDAASVTFRFAMQPQEGDANAEITKQLTGTLVVAKPHGRPLRLVVENAGPLSPQFGFKLRAFRQAVEFREHDALGVVVPREMQFRMRAKAFGLKTIKVDTTIEYRDFQCPPGVTAAVAGGG